MTVPSGSFGLLAVARWTMVPRASWLTGSASARLGWPCMRARMCPVVTASLTVPSASRSWKMGEAPMLPMLRMVASVQSLPVVAGR